MEEMEEQDRKLLEDCACLAPLHEALSEEIYKNKQEALLQDIEMPLSEVLASMEMYGFEVDTAALTEYGKMLDEKIEDYQNVIYHLAGEQFNINSPKQLGEVLFEHLGLPAKKRPRPVIRPTQMYWSRCEENMRLSTRFWSTAR